MMRRCSNGRHMLISNKESVEDELESHCAPEIVLLTAWTSEIIHPAFLKTLVTFLLNRGAVCFVCVGDFSEQLHDEIDQILYRYDEEHESNIGTEVVTTYHAGEPIEDAINFYIHGTQLNGEENGCLLAILDSGAPQDREIKTLLESA